MARLMGQMTDAADDLDRCSTAARHNGDRLRSSPKRVEGDIHRYTYATDAELRARKLAQALARPLPGDRVATLAWNGYRHFEICFGSSGRPSWVPHHQPAPAFPSRSPGSPTTRPTPGALLRPQLPAAGGEAGAGADQREALRCAMVGRRQRQSCRRRPRSRTCCAYEAWSTPRTAVYRWPEFDEHRRGEHLLHLGTTGNPGKGASLQPPLDAAACLPPGPARRPEPVERQ